MSQVVSNGSTAQIPMPLVLRWSSSENPVPQRPVKWPPGSTPRKHGLEAPPWYDTGEPEKPFAFCERMKALAADIASQCSKLSHLDVSRLLFTMVQARNGNAHGLQARVTPLRFQEGDLFRKRKGVAYQVQRFIVDDVEMLYLVTFCLPRFLDQTFEEKLITLFHELYHISPELNGDLRRHKGRYSIHTHSKAEYDQQMAAMAREYLSQQKTSSHYDFLRLDFAQLQHRHGSVISNVVPRPQVIPLATLSDHPGAPA